MTQDEIEEDVLHSVSAVGQGVAGHRKAAQKSFSQGKSYWDIPPEGLPAEKAGIRFERAFGSRDRDDLHILLGAGVDPNVVMPNGFSPLGYAAHYGLDEKANELIDAGATLLNSPNWKDDNPNLPLMEAMMFGRTHLMEMLLDQDGVDPNWVDTSVNKTVAMHLAVAPLEEEYALNVLDRFIDMGLDHSIQDGDGKTILELFEENSASLFLHDRLSDIVYGDQAVETLEHLAPASQQGKSKDNGSEFGL